LDPHNTGLINFHQFCDGIAQISCLQGVSLKDVASDLSRRSRENSLVEDSDQRSLVRDKIPLVKRYCLILTIAIVQHIIVFCSCLFLLKCFDFTVVYDCVAHLIIFVRFFFFFQTQDGSTTTFNEYDVENDEAYQQAKHSTNNHRILRSTVNHEHWHLPIETKPIDSLS
jgi:hypothetical protein